MSKLSLFFGVILLLTQSCDLLMEHASPEVSPVQSITIVNNLDVPICYLLSNQNPDTSLFVNYPFSSIDKHTIMGKSKITLQPNEYAISDFLGKAPSTIPYLFLFSKNIIETVPWTEIRDRYLILKRNELSLSYLQENNWLISYP